MPNEEVGGFVGDFPLWACVDGRDQAPVGLGLLNGAHPFVGLFTDEDLVDRFLVAFPCTAEKAALRDTPELLLFLARGLAFGATHAIFDPSPRGGAARYTATVGQLVEQIGKSLQGKPDRPTEVWR